MWGATALGVPASALLTKMRLTDQQYEAYLEYEAWLRTQDDGEEEEDGDDDVAGGGGEQRESTTATATAATATRRRRRRRRDDGARAVAPPKPHAALDSEENTAVMCANPL